MGSVEDQRTHFDQKLREAWNRGMSKKEVVYQEATSVTADDHGIPFEVRYLPCLDKKPTDDRPSTPSSDTEMKDADTPPKDPFAEPRDNVIVEMEQYTCVLNKYALERGHFLCVTNEWYPQKGLLRAQDLRIMYDLVSNLSARHYCFFNCGQLAGASQEHRHFQFLGVPAFNTPCWPDQIYLRDKQATEIQMHEHIPAYHFLLPILDSSTIALETTFQRLFSTAQQAIHTSDNEMPYNLMLTKEYMLLFPRRHEEWDEHEIGVGGTCLAGQIMVTKTEDIQLAKEIGIREFLRYVGFPTSETKSVKYNGVTLEDPDVRLAAEVLQDLKSIDNNSPAFLNRVSEYPIVSTAVRAYETGKNSSRGFNYAATTIENIARPVVSRFEPLDDFACRQLDRIEGRKRRTDDLECNKRSSIDKDDEEVRRGRWHSVLHLSLSEDSVKSLKYCSDWLHWANGHVHHLIGNLNTHVDGTPMRDLSPEQLNTLSNSMMYVKREISDTLKKLMGIVSDYAGTALPEPARSRVRGYVLGMPSRWAARQRQSPEHVEGETELDREFISVTSLANESLEVLRNVADIVGRTIHSFSRTQ